MIDLLDGRLRAPVETGRMYGLVIGVVTNNQDPDGLGRVKVRFPWLSESDESRWARVLTPMAGNDRGLFLLPEVDDEVLVGFEHGRVEFPYILGALWNGKDKPPADNGDGKNNLRILKSRSGHTITLDDTDGGEKIEIADSSGKQTLVFDASQNTITITADKDIVIESKNGSVKITGQMGVEISAPAGAGKVETAQNLDIRSNAQVNVRGTGINLN